MRRVLFCAGKLGCRKHCLFVLGSNALGQQDQTMHFAAPPDQLAIRLCLLDLTFHRMSRTHIYTTRTTSTTSSDCFWLPSKRSDSSDSESSRTWSDSSAGSDGGECSDGDECSDCGDSEYWFELSHIEWGALEMDYLKPERVCKSCLLLPRAWNSMAGTSTEYLNPLWTPSRLR